MGKPKKYDIRSINFGEVGHPARILVGKFVKMNGKTALSILMRRLVVCYLSNNPEYVDWKKQYLINQRKELGKDIAGKAEQRNKIDAQLRELGVNPEEILYD